MNEQTRDDPQADLAQRIDAIESGYEFMLAYAAQGRDTDRGAKSSPGVRDFLTKMDSALDGLGAVVQTCLRQRDPGWLDLGGAFVGAVEDDAAKAQGAIRLVLAQPDISSQLIDNLNATIHLRALLTDMFVIDEVLKKKAPAAS